MDSCSAWEKLNIKTRKPYTITKQRERWTEDEHNRFLEALKLYGRAWQRIEEHIGTKTAVQIRSHAQKFFTKLEKEAVAKGVPIGQALDVKIPPPRPKRKPNYPYPRKTHTREAEKPDVSSLQFPDLERKPLPEKTSHTENLENEKTSMEAQNGIEGSVENENSIPNESCITIETIKQDDIKHTNINSSLFESSHLALENIIQGRYSAKPANLINDIQGKQTYPRHVPVQVVDVHHEVSAKTSVPLEMSFRESKVNKLGEVHEHPNPPNLFVNIAAASASSGQNHNDAPPFTPLSDNLENHRSFLHVSSTTSSVIVSSLLQNPAAHAAASFADSFSRYQLNPETTPSMAVIAAATVAAATAWWSAHGLLPVCTPFHSGGYSCMFQMPAEENQVRMANTGTEKAPSDDVLQEEKMDAENAESAADLSYSSDEPEEKLNSKETVSVMELHGSSKTGVGKLVDRSSCDSNTSSSSEIVMDVLEKDEKETEETKVPDVKESISSRGKITIIPNESWKGVSDEARLAFQALFSRQVLPRSFSNNPTAAEKDQPNINKNSELDLSKMSQEPRESNDFVVLRSDEGVLRMGLGSVKVNVHHTGFRPYKKCSIEAKESCKLVSVASTGNQNGEKCPKRMRLGAEAST